MTLAYVIFRIEHPTLKSWQLLFLIEGGATCLVALFAWAWLPEGPESAWFLTEEERRVFRRRRRVVDRTTGKGWTTESDDERMNGRYHGEEDTEIQRMVVTVPSAEDVEEEEEEEEEEASGRLVTWREIVQVVRDWKLWLLLFCNICASVPSTAFSVFLPLVVEDMGFSSLQANLVRFFFLHHHLPILTPPRYVIYVHQLTLTYRHLKRCQSPPSSSAP